MVASDGMKRPAPAEEATLLCAGCGKPPPKGGRHQCCPLCQDLQLPPWFACSMHCPGNPWPSHWVWHDEHFEMNAALRNAGADETPQQTGETLQQESPCANSCASCEGVLGSAAQNVQQPQVPMPAEASTQPMPSAMLMPLAPALSNVTVIAQPLPRATSDEVVISRPRRSCDQRAWAAESAQHWQGVTVSVMAQPVGVTGQLSAAALAHYQTLDSAQQPIVTRPPSAANTSLACATESPPQRARSHSPQWQRHSTSELLPPSPQPQSWMPWPPTIAGGSVRLSKVPRSEAEEGAARSSDLAVAAASGTSDWTLQAIFVKYVMCDFTPRRPSTLPTWRWATLEQLLDRLQLHRPLDVQRLGPNSLRQLITEWFKGNPAFEGLAFTQWGKRLKDNNPQAHARSLVFKFSFEHTPGGVPAQESTR